MLAGLEEIDAGAIYIGDRDVTYVPPKNRDVSMVFQNYALYPYLTVAQNIGFPLKIAKVKKAKRETRVREVATMLGLEGYLDRKPGQLSGGERQRVAMGRAIVRVPSVFLMDEPLSNLDAKLRVQMRADVAALQTEFGVTTVYVTHDQAEAMTLGHRVAVLRDGKLQQCGPPRELYDRPTNTFVAGFIGSPAMNLCAVQLGANGSLALGDAQVAIGDALRRRALERAPQCHPRVCARRRSSSARKACPPKSRSSRSSARTRTSSAWLTWTTRASSSSREPTHERSRDGVTASRSNPGRTRHTYSTA